MLSLLTLNIGAAAHQRADKILRWLADRPEQVFLLTETSAGPGTAHLLDRFRRAGCTVIGAPAPGERGAALISRVPAITREEPAELGKVSIPGRLAAAVLDTLPQVCVAAVYVPNSDRTPAKTERKQTFITSLLDALHTLPGHHREHLILGGDYNVISRTHQPAHTGFRDFEYGLLDGLDELGLIDAHAYLHPADQPHSWFGRTGGGYRYDYFHIGPGLAGRLTASAYPHEPRGHKLSDHAAQTITLDITAAEITSSDPSEDGTATLF